MSKVVFLAVALVAGRLLADVPLHDFEDSTLWQPNPDGGHAPQVWADTQVARTGAALRIRYTNVPPGWGNLTGPCQVPPDARALRFWVCKHSAAPKAALHIWLFEPDGDGWVQQVRFDGKTLPDLEPGWYEVRMPVGAFAFEPRGPKTPQMTTVDRMLIGCNFAHLEVTVDDMTWETGPGQQDLPLPRTPNLTVQRGELGSIGILDMGDGLPGFFTAAHPPAELARVIAGADAADTAGGPGSFGATILKAGDLADATVLTPDNFDAVILPCGPHFPLAAREAFIAYLKAGGSFLSTDGYAFDSLEVLTGAGWSPPGTERTADQMTELPEPPRPLNTRTGRPGDAMTFEPDQIPIFDPQFPLEHATAFRLAEGYAATIATASTDGPPPARAPGRLPHYDFAAPVTGFSACGLIGLNNPVFPDVYRRWIPVLEAYAVSPACAVGEGQKSETFSLRGAALAIMHNYAGPFRGSSWAFSGLTGRSDDPGGPAPDLFLGDDSRRALLVRVLRDITEKVYLHELTTDLACYEPGETVLIRVKVSNHGRRPAARTLHVWVGEGNILQRELQLQPGETRVIEASQPVDDYVGDRDGCIPCGATLIEGRDSAARIADRIESAFCIRDDKVLASGPKLGWSDNYLTVDGRPTFLIGSNQTGMMFYSPHETPAVWDRDFRTMAEHNFRLLRILHFSPFSKGGYEGAPTNNPLDLAQRPLRLVRQMDAIVQLAQKHRVAIFLSLHDWMGVDLTDEQLAAQADWNRFWAQRYRDVPGILYDIQNEPSVGTADRPDIVALWNAFLQHRYGSDEALRAAWTRHPPEAPLPNVPLGPTSEDWDDVRRADRKRFESEVLNRWIRANVDGIRAGDPDALVCVGYLPWMAPADKMLGTRYTDFSNMHYYGPAGGFATEFGLIDRRFDGKGLSVGECGAQEAHDARTGGSYTVPVEESIQRFQTYLHYTAGMGGAFLCNWDWKDFDESVFPWGLMHHGSNIPKPWLHTWGQGSLLLGVVEPAYDPPPVFILAPDRHRIGPRFDDLHNALKRSVELMLNQRVSFGMINEEDLARLPDAAKVLLWPLPYCPEDETFAQVLAWVRAGGTLYLSGDVAFDATRKPTRRARRTDLGLPETAPLPPFETPGSAWTQPPVETRVGQGKVLFVPYPLELRGQPGDEAIYRRVLELGGITPVRVEPAQAPVRVLTVPTRDGGRLFMLHRTSAAEDLLAVSMPDLGLQVELAKDGFAFVLCGPDRSLLAVESQGEIRMDGQLLARADGHYGLCVLDGRDLRLSRQVLVLPHHTRRVDLPGLAGVVGGRCCMGTLGSFGVAPLAGAAGTPTPTAERDFAGSLDFSPPAGAVAVVCAEQEMVHALRRLSDLASLRFGP